MTNQKIYDPRPTFTPPTSSGGGLIARLFPRSHQIIGGISAHANYNRAVRDWEQREAQRKADARQQAERDRLEAKRQAEIKRVEQREDTAVQRHVADMRRAGINPSTASASFGSSSAGSPAIQGGDMLQSLLDVSHTSGLDLSTLALLALTISRLKG